MAVRACDTTGGGTGGGGLGVVWWWSGGGAWIKLCYFIAGSFCLKVGGAGRVGGGGGRGRFVPCASVSKDGEKEATCVFFFSSPAAAS